MEQQLLAQLEYLQGQVAGLQAALRGLILAHPNPAHAAGVVEQLLEEAQARGLASPSATDHMLRGLASSPNWLVPTDGQINRAFELNPDPQARGIAGRVP